MSRIGRFVLDASVRRSGGARVLIGGSPLKLFRMTEAGADLIDRVSRGDEIATMPPSAPTERLLDRLMDAGVIHPAPLPNRRDGAAGVDVTIVIPAFDTPIDLSLIHI